MIRKPENTKQKILQLGEKLLKEKGINAFSYHDISSALGVKNAAIHYHFGSKEDLLLAIIEENRRRFGRMAQKVGTTPEANVWHSFEEFLNIYISNIENNRQICLFGSLGSDFFTIGHQGQEHLKKFSEKILTWLGEILTEGRNQGEFEFDGNARTRALMICSTLTGGLQLSRISGKKDFYDLVDQIKSDLKPNSGKTNKEI